jgi:nitronate monooxygenase
MQKLTTLLNITYPIVQAPMLGVTTPAMVAAVSNAGALGSLPVGGLSPERTRELIRSTKELTDQPFAVNLFAHPPATTVNQEEVSGMQDFLAQLCKEHAMPYERQDVSNFRFYYYEDLIDVLLEEKIPVVSFTFGQLSDEVTSALKENHATLIGTATSVAEAKRLAQAGVDVITVQGIEAGGHRGTFLADEPLPQVGLSALLPQIADVTDLPLLATGGIFNGRTMKAAFSLGASGVQVGSVFIPAHESAASQAYKEAVLNSKDTDTILTQAFSGRWARGLKNGFMQLMNAQHISIPYYTIQNQLMAPIRGYAQQQGMTDFIAMWAGQSAGKAVRASTSEIMKGLVQQFKAIA